MVNKSDSIDQRSSRVVWYLSSPKDSVQCKGCTDLLSLLELSKALLSGLLLALSLLQQRLWDEDLVLRRHGSVGTEISV